MILEVSGNDQSLFARVEISPARARQLLAAMAMLPEMITPIGPPLEMSWCDSAPDFYEDEECQELVRTEGGMLHVDSTSVFWTAYVKHSEDTRLVTRCVDTETLSTIAFMHGGS